jgi:hypothetical protein
MAFTLTTGEVQAALLMYCAPAFISPLPGWAFAARTCAGIWTQWKKPWPSEARALPGRRRKPAAHEKAPRERGSRTYELHQSYGPKQNHGRGIA